MEAGIHHLLCCRLHHPLGAENPLCFSWHITGMEQAGYCLRVFPEGEKDACYDSGLVETAEVFTPALELPLESSRPYRFEITAYGRKGEQAAASGLFETGLLTPQEKAVPFITSPEGWENPIFRRVITIGSGLKKARLYLCGLGYSDLRINGRAVSDAWFQPVVSNYHERDFSNMLYPFHDTMSCSAYYMTYDITPFLHTGENVLTAELGNGFYNQRERTVEGQVHFGPPKLLLVCKTWDDSGLHALTADTSWRCAPGPLVENNLFSGEVYEARREADIGSPDYDDSSWPYAVLAPEHMTVLRPQLCPPDRLEQVIHPLCLGQAEGRMVYDCGENLTGVVRIRGDFPLGESRTLRFAEHLTAEGKLDFRSAGGVEQIQRDTYIGNGKPGQVYAPRFCWHGFRYFDIDGPVKEAEVLKIHADVPGWGDLRTSDYRLNRIVEAFRRSLLSNMHGGVISDCPHRERLGYTGDGQVTLDSALLLFDGVNFYEKWLRDIADCQDVDSGHVQHTAPFFGGGGGPGGWGCAIILAPWALYRHTGDAAPLGQYYGHMEKWMAYLRSRSDGHIVIREEEGGWCLGDWAFPEGRFAPTEAYVNSCYYGHCAAIMAEISRILGKEEQETAYSRLAEEIRRSVKRRFYEESTSLFDRLPLGNVYARFLGISTPESDRKMVEHYRQMPYFDTGIFGTPLLLEALAELGEQELALQLLCSREGPSFAYLFDGKETTLRESWLGGQSDNHHMFGTAAGFLMRMLLGFPRSLAGGNWTLAPYLPAGLDYAQGYTETAYGRLAVSWIKNGDSALCTVQLPGGVRCRLLYRGREYRMMEGENTVVLPL